MIRKPFGSRFAFWISLMVASGAGLVAILLPAAGSGSVAVTNTYCNSTTGAGNLCAMTEGSINDEVQVSGGSTLTLAGNLWVQSSSSSGLHVSGGSHVTANDIGVHGNGFGPPLDPGSSISPTPDINQPLETDPFSAVFPNAECSDPATNLVTGTTATATPGTYSNLGVSGTGVLTLDPGEYWITGTFSAGGTGTITGTGVTLFFCDGAHINIASGTTVTLTGSVCTHCSGYDFVIFYKQTNTQPIQIDDANAVFTGEVYAIGATCLQVQHLTVNGDIIVDCVNLHSGGTLTTTGETPTTTTAGPTTTTAGPTTTTAGPTTTTAGPTTTTAGPTTTTAGPTTTTAGPTTTTAGPTTTTAGPTTTTAGPTTTTAGPTTTTAGPTTTTAGPTTTTAGPTTTTAGPTTTTVGETPTTTTAGPTTTTAGSSPPPAPTTTSTTTTTTTRPTTTTLGPPKVNVGGVNVTKTATPPAPKQVFTPKNKTTSGKKSAGKTFPFAQKNAKGAKASFTG